MFAFRILSNKIRDSCAEKFLSTIHQQGYMMLPQYSNSQQLFTLNKTKKNKKGRLSLFTLSMHTHQPTQGRLNLPPHHPPPL